MYLIIGASSFIGSHIYWHCKKIGREVLGTYYAHPGCSEWVPFDICKDDLWGFSQRNLAGKPLEAVILCGANASIDKCKRDVQASHLLNVERSWKVLKQAGEMGAKAIFLSSEAVFDGEKGMYVEEDIPSPITVYGRQKLQVEQKISQELENYLIFRISRAVSSSYGEKDILGEFYNKIMAQEDIVCLKNQSFCLTEVEDIARVMIEAIDKDKKGLYHVSSGNYLSRYELALLFADKIFGGYGKIFEKEYRDIPFADKRHIYGGLEGKKLAGLLKFHYMDTEGILQKYKRTIPGGVWE